MITIPRILYTDRHDTEIRSHAARDRNNSCPLSVDKNVAVTSPSQAQPRLTDDQLNIGCKHGLSESCVLASAVTSKQPWP